MERLISILVIVMLIEMRIAIGLRVSCGDLSRTLANWRLILGALLANYVCVPAMAAALLVVLRTSPLVAAGILILAVCPGAPFGPSCTALAKGNVSASVGLMAILAGSSALLAPLLLPSLLGITAGHHVPSVDPLSIVRVLFVTQLAPLFAGLAVRQFFPLFADRMARPAERLSSSLSLLTITAVLTVHGSKLLEIRPSGCMGMTVLLLASWGSGWVLGGHRADNQKALAITTGLRNVGVALAIANVSFPDTPAVTAALAYGLFEIFGTIGLALWWNWRAATVS